MKGTLFRLAAALLGAAGCALANDGEAESVSDLEESAWTARRDERSEAIEAYLAEDRSNFDAFSNQPLGASGNELMPFVLFRVLPDVVRALAESQGTLATDMEDLPSLVREGWLADVGLRDGGGSTPVALTWTRPAAESNEPSLVARTCAGCHTGRVRLDDGSIRLLHGAPSTEARIHDYNHRVSRVVAKISQHLVQIAEATPERPAQFAPKEELKALVVDLIERRHRESPTFFFRNEAGYDASVEAREIAKVEAGLDTILPVLRAVNEKAMQNRQKVEGGPYHAPNSPDFNSAPGGSFDTTSTALAPVVSAEHLPKAPTRVDLPAVWNQKTRVLGEWDGRMRSATIRNLSAALANVGNPAKIDFGAVARVTDFVRDLPSSPYPFDDVPAALEARGQALYQQNCANCHTEDQRTLAGEPRVWGATWGEGPSVVAGTDQNRADGVDEVGFRTFTGVLKLTAGCTNPNGPPEATTSLCASADRWLVLRTTPETRGYIAAPLDGVWARAPYLHNGSVPTLRHLLTTGPRPTTFLRGSIAYDKKNAGWEWDPRRADLLRRAGDTITTFDTTRNGNGNHGHSGDVVVDGHAMRMTWNAEDPAIDALIAYLKTL